MNTPVCRLCGDNLKLTIGRNRKEEYHCAIHEFYITSVINQYGRKEQECMYDGISYRCHDAADMAKLDSVIAELPTFVCDVCGEKSFLKLSTVFMDHENKRIFKRCPHCPGLIPYNGLVEYMRTHTETSTRRRAELSPGLLNVEEILKLNNKTEEQLLEDLEIRRTIYSSWESQWVDL